MASNRRRGGESSATRAALVDAAEALMRQEGYPAVTARNLADRVSLKRQIVHYYFQSMDDVFVAVIRRNAEGMRGRLEAALSSAEPLRTLWEINSDPDQAIMAAELIALANRRPAIRAEVADVAEAFRDLQTGVLVAHLQARGVSPGMSPVVATVLLTSLSQGLTLERGIGLTRGHAETLQFVDACLQAFAESREPPMPFAHGDLDAGAHACPP